MKRISLMLIVLGAFFMAPQVHAQKAEKEKKKKVVVRGNCGMCEENIETAAMNVDGVVSADWDKEQEVLTVVFYPKQTSLSAVEQSVANTGYDTKNFVGNEEAYQNLPNCCQYDDKKHEK